MIKWREVLRYTLLAVSLTGLLANLLAANPTTEILATDQQDPISKNMIQAPRVSLQYTDVHRMVAVSL